MRGDGKAQEPLISFLDIQPGLHAVSLHFTNGRCQDILRIFRVAACHGFHQSAGVQTPGAAAPQREGAHVVVALASLWSVDASG